MKRKSLIVIFGIVLCLLCYFGYKGYYFSSYKRIYEYSVEEMNNSISNIYNAKVLNYEKTNNNQLSYETFGFKNLYAYQIYDNFKIKEESTFTRYYRDETKYIDLAILEDDFNTMVNQYTSIRNGNLKEYLSKNDIDNRDDIVKFLYNKKIEKSNILTSLKKMEENNMDYYLANYIGYYKSGYYKLNGNINGYIASVSTNKIIAKINNIYNISFNNFTMEEATEFLNFVIINNEN